ncbi:ADP-ribosyl-[dinitrogen reductase] hydrolase [Marmoricola sp. OAE513]|uniref:ADP-ribosylglycohydrolase family protein n=1 Tax=Marmoricola sp. OAE513 TaxID=2817894 RepID=UPI001AE5A81A
MTMTLTPAQTDRACGVLIGCATGDALGAGYEFEPISDGLVPDMIGGGLGNGAPGEWTDDTAQAVAIALVAATGVDLRSEEALDKIAQHFADWYGGHPPDVGNQTARVLRSAGRNPSGASMAAAAKAVHDSVGRSAGNGSLMRTGPVALAYLDDPEGLVEAAMAVSALTHYEEIAQQACAVWCLMIRHAVLHGEFPQFADIADWVPDPERWERLLGEAELGRPGSFVTNAWAVGALQAAWSSICNTAVPTEDPRRHLVDSLGTAIRIGCDTDTVAAIAGSLLGARWGMTAIPARWQRMLRGWPDLGVQQLERLAYLTVHQGRPGHYGWPEVARIDYTSYQFGQDALVRHPSDDDVWLGGATALDVIPEDVDAVVSLCLVGSAQVPDGLEHHTFRLMDESAPEKNPNLDFVLLDAARLVATLRDEGKTVLLHCVAGHSRTPTVGVAYAMLRGVAHDEAYDAVCAALPAARPNRGFRAALQRLAAQGITA